MAIFQANLVPLRFSFFIWSISVLEQAKTYGKMCYKQIDINKYNGFITHSL